MLLLIKINGNYAKKNISTEQKTTGKETRFQKKNEIKRRPQGFEETTR